MDVALTVAVDDTPFSEWSVALALIGGTQSNSPMAIAIVASFWDRFFLSFVIICSSFLN